MKSLLLSKALLNDFIIELPIEIGPLVLLNSAISIGIKFVKEPLDRGFNMGRISIRGQTGPTLCKLLNFESINISIAIDI